MKREGILIVISGFAGTGKGTIVKELIRKYEQFALSVSMTTRAPREGEVDGQSYFFVTKEEFEEKIGQDGFVEHACYCDNYYGTPKEYVEKQLFINQIDFWATLHVPLLMYSKGEWLAKTSCDYVKTLLEQGYIDNSLWGL